MPRKMNGNLKLVLSVFSLLIVVGGIIVGITLSYADNKANADKAHNEIKAVEEKQDIINHVVNEKLDDIKLEQRAQSNKLDRVIEHMRIPAKK